MFDVSPVRYQSSSETKCCAFWPRPSRPCKIRRWMGEISELVFRLAIIKSPLYAPMHFIFPTCCSVSNSKPQHCKAGENRGQISDSLSSCKNYGRKWSKCLSQFFRTRRWPKISGRRGRPTNYSSCFQTRINVLSWLWCKNAGTTFLRLTVWQRDWQTAFSQLDRGAMAGRYLW